VSHHQGGDLQLLDYVSDGESLARTCRAQQHLVAVALLDALHELADSFGLIPRRLIRCV